jgi:SAM-dependent methyltransferase
MLIEYANLKFGYHDEGWDLAFRDRDIDQYRFRLLINDHTIHSVFKEIYMIVADLRAAGRPVTMLDVGCGTGHQIASLAYLCDRSVGFDISPAVIENNRCLNTTTEYILGDALRHPSFKEPFTVVLMAGVLYSIDGRRETHLRILREVHRALADEGTFVFYHRGYLSLVKYLDLRIRALRDRIMKNQKRDYAMCYFDDRYIRSLCDQVGFEIIRSRKSDFAYYLCNTIFKKILTRPSPNVWDSFANLNLLGRFVYIVAKYAMPFLCARSSTFILKKA